MKFDDVTIEVLKNFQTINPSIQIDKGNVITTVAPTKLMIATANVPMEFPRTFAIHEVRRLLSVISLMKNGEVEFKDSFLILRDGKREMHYGYCSPEAIIIPEHKPSRFKKEDVYIDFMLPPELFAQAINAMSVLEHVGVQFVGKNGKLFIETVPQANSHSFSVELGETDKQFKFVFKSTTLNFLTREYKVTLSKKKYMHLESSDVQYWIAADIKSEIE